MSESMARYGAIALVACTTAGCVLPPPVTPVYGPPPPAAAPSAATPPAPAPAAPPPRPAARPPSVYSPAPPAVAVPAPPRPPETVNVSVVGILVGIKSNRLAWDGPGTLSNDNVGAISEAMVGTGNLYGAAAVQVANLASAGFQPPDVGGHVDVYSARATTSLDLAKVQDSYTPTWSDASIGGVPLDRSVRIRVTLYDRDLVDDDPMGVVELNLDDLRAAYEAGRIHHVRVDDQSNGQVLFVDISVRGE